MRPKRMNGINGPALDRYITGNYGEDQFRGPHICDDCNVEFDSYGSWEEHECSADEDLARSKE